MGLYSRHIFPRLCDWMMSDPRMSRLRHEALAGVGGEVLEIGFGTGLNLPHYPPHVRREGRPDTLENALDHAEHVAEVCGIEHVALGADLDGFDPPGLPAGADTPSCYGLIEAGLLARGWRREHVDLALGGNALRVLSRVLR